MTPNAWVVFLKDYSKKNKIPYSCAVANPECKRLYRLQKPTATQLLGDLEGIEPSDYNAMHAFVEKKLQRSSPEVTIAAVLKKFGYS